MRATLLIAILLTVVSDLFACDICHIYLSLQPNDFRHRIGLNYRHRILNGTTTLQLNPATQPKHLDNENVSDNDSGSKMNLSESYTVVELQADYQLNEKWQIRASLPYLKTESFYGENRKYQVSAVGDPWAMLQYMLLSSEQSEKQSALNHRLRIGIGLKFPLGKTNQRFNDESLPFDMQPGSGSYDYLGSLEYILRWKSLGFSASGVYKLNGENLSEYRFGNTLQASTLLFNLIQKQKLYWMPFTGLNYEIANTDHSKGEELNSTGGDVLFLGTGLEVGSSKFSVQCSAQKGIHDHLKNSVAPARWRFTAGVNYFINSN